MIFQKPAHANIACSESILSRSRVFVKYLRNSYHKAEDIVNIKAVICSGKKMIKLLT